MANIIVEGCVATHGGVKYIFRCNEDALAFKQCCEKGRRPEDCADKYHGVKKSMAEEVSLDDDSNMSSPAPSI